MTILLQGAGLQAVTSVPAGPTSLLDLEADIGITTSIAPFAGTGTLTQSGTTVTGVDTLALSEIIIGDRVTSAGGAIDGIVQYVDSDTAWRLDTSANVAVGVGYNITPQSTSATISTPATYTISRSVSTARVSTWSDQSGSGHHFTQSGFARPSYIATDVDGTPSLIFNGVSQWLEGSDFADNPASLTIFTVLQVPIGTVTGSSHVICKINNLSDGAGWSLYSDIGSLVTQEAGGSTYRLDTVTESISALDGTWVVATGEITDLNTLQIYWNGAAPTQSAGGTGGVTDISNVENVKIGRSGDDPSNSGEGYLRVRCKAIRLYSPALDSTDRAAIEAELAARYGITL